MTYAYDPLSLLASVTDASGVTSYSYEAVARAVARRGRRLRATRTRSAPLATDSLFAELSGRSVITSIIYVALEEENAA